MHRCCVFVAVAACAANEPTPDAAPVLTDVRVPLPDPDPAFLDLVTPEVVIEPGHEAIYCFYLDNPGPTFGTDRIEATQGEGGHHLAFRRAEQRRPTGTFEECTATQEELGLGDLFLGTGALPLGWAVELHETEQFVIETHYLNATDLPLLARDVVRVHRAEASAITKWVHPMHLKTYDLVVAPGDSTLAFDCTAPADLELFEFWGHQHGAGVRVRVELTPPSQATTVLYDARWGIDPPIGGSTTSALSIAANTRARIICTWQNASDRSIAYPDEMCAFGGYVTGAEFSCIGDVMVPVP